MGTNISKYYYGSFSKWPLVLFMRVNRSLRAPFRNGQNVNNKEGFLQSTKYLQQKKKKTVCLLVNLCKRADTINIISETTTTVTTAAIYPAASADSAAAIPFIQLLD